MRIIAVDPGGTAGVAFGAFHEGVPPDVTLFEMTPHEALFYVGDSLPVDLVVCESFIPRPGVRTWQPDALEMIGALRYLCRVAGVRFELQSPASAKRLATNARLDALGWRHRTPGGHADDAARHLLVAAMRHRQLAAGGLVED